MEAIKVSKKHAQNSIFDFEILLLMITKYGMDWPEGTSPLTFELWALSQSDEFLKSQGTERYKVYLKAHRIAWPEDVQHRWFIQGIKSLCQNQITVMMGSASSTKTYTLSVHALLTYWSIPNSFLGLVSSTDMQSLELRIWGRGIKWLFNRARTRFPFLAGNVIESKKAIATQDIDEDGDLARQLDIGLQCVPAKTGGTFVGLSKFQGIKAPNTPGKSDGLLAVYGDELATMQRSYLDVFSNFVANRLQFKAGLSGNPTDISDPLCIAAEPMGGWDSFEDTRKTQEWTSKWYDAHVIAFDGRDTPNNDVPKDSFPFLTPSDHVLRLEQTHGKDSWHVWTMGIGKPSRGMVSNRVLTTGLCDKHHAFDQVLWKGGGLTRLGAVDPAYGGGDRCVWREPMFGEDQDGNIVLVPGQPEIIPIRMNSGIEPEEQIAEWVKARSDATGISPDHIFYDSFGRGTLGAAFAKVFGYTCPVPVNSGDKATKRPVRIGYMVEENINGYPQKRPKRCDEEYSKFITEMWFSVREVVESDQMRELDRSTAEEFQSRIYSVVSGNRVEVETKDDMKARIRKSPDYADCLAVGVEGARRLGFEIKRIGAAALTEEEDDLAWLAEKTKKHEEWLKSKSLSGMHDGFFKR